jgi:hypothetical protein
MTRNQLKTYQDEAAETSLIGIPKEHLKSARKASDAAFVRAMELGATVSGERRDEVACDFCKKFAQSLWSFFHIESE